MSFWVRVKTRWTLSVRTRSVGVRPKVRSETRSWKIGARTPCRVGELVVAVIVLQREYLSLTRKSGQVWPARSVGSGGLGRD